MTQPDKPTLDEKIMAAAIQRGDRYTPSQQEWDRATRMQRRAMTWPAHIIDWIRRNP